MAKSWFTGALKSLFGMNTDTKHWAAVKDMMEQSFGEIKIDRPIEGGPVRAFFAEQTLVGDETQTHCVVHSHASVTLDMKEAIGTGKDRPTAIVSLWNNITDIEQHHTILQLQEPLYKGGEQLGLYMSAKLSNGTFQDYGAVKAELPPARPEFIVKFLEDEKNALKGAAALAPNSP